MIFFPLMMLTFIPVDHCLVFLLFTIRQQLIKNGTPMLKEVIVFSSESSHKWEYQMAKRTVNAILKLFTNVSSTGITWERGTLGKPTCSHTALWVWIAVNPHIFHHAKSYILITWATELCNMWDVAFSTCCEGFTLNLA